MCDRFPVSGALKLTQHESGAAGAGCAGDFACLEAHGSARIVAKCRQIDFGCREIVQPPPGKGQGETALVETLQYGVADVPVAGTAVVGENGPLVEKIVVKLTGQGLFDARDMLPIDDPQGQVGTTPTRIDVKSTCKEAGGIFIEAQPDALPPRLGFEKPLQGHIEVPCRHLAKPEDVFAALVAETVVATRGDLIDDTVFQDELVSGFPDHAPLWPQRFSVEFILKRKLQRCVGT